MGRGKGRRKKLIWLLSVERGHVAELRADFRRYYGLKYDQAVDEDIDEAADLAAMLPQGSRLHAALNPVNGWTLEQYEGAVTANAIFKLIHMLGGGKGAAPKVFELPSAPTSQDEEVQTMGFSELMEVLSRPRTV